MTDFSISITERRSASNGLLIPPKLSAKKTSKARVVESLK